MDQCNIFVSKSRPLLKKNKNYSFLVSSYQPLQVRVLFSSFIASDVHSATTLLIRFAVRLSRLLHNRTFCKYKKNVLIEHTKHLNLISTFGLTSDQKYELSFLNLNQGNGWRNKLKNVFYSILGHGSMKAVNQLPQPTALRTVTRSPHVFKKTREQFGMVKCKHCLSYYFKSTKEAELFINCISLIKFPAEVQIGLSGI